MRPLLLLLTAGLLLTGRVYAQTWYPVGPGGGSDLQALAMHPTDPNTYYVVGDIEGIYKTTDGGQTWRLINNNLVQDIYGGAIYYVLNLVLDPQNPERIYACTQAGLFRSEDGGASWNPLYVVNDGETTETLVADVAIDPTNSRRIFMAIGDPASAGTQDYVDELFQPWTFPADLNEGVFLSEDDGVTWQELPVGLLPHTGVNDMLLVDSQTILLSTMNGVYRSTDGGQTWEEKNTGLPHRNTQVFQLVPTSPVPTLFLTVHTVGDVARGESDFTGGVYRSRDLGDTWEDVTGNLPRFDSANQLFYEYWRLAAHPDWPDRLFVANTRGGSWEKAGIYVTENALADQPTWTLLYAPQRGAWIAPPFFVDPFAFILGVHPADARLLITGTVGVEISQDGGQTWTQVYAMEIGTDAWRGNGMEMMNTETIAFAPSDVQRFYVGYDDFGPFRTDNGGNSFRRLDARMDPELGPLWGIDGVKDILVDPENADHLYISRWQGSQGGYSTNYYAGGVVRSTDGGYTHVPIMNGLPLADNYPDVGAGRFDLALDPVSGSPGQRTLYAAVYHHGVYKTTSSGASWQPVNQGLGTWAERAWEVLVNPFNPSEVFLGTISRDVEDPLPQGLFKSADGGQTWQRITTLPQGGDVLYLHMDANQRLYALVVDNFDWPGEGFLFRSTDGGKTWETLFTGQYLTGVDTRPDQSAVIALAASQSYRNSIVPHGVYVSTDDGRTWKLVSHTPSSQKTLAGPNVVTEPLQHMFINVIRFNPHVPEHLYVGTAGGGLWQSTDVFTTAVEEEAPEALKVALYPDPFGERLFVTLPSASAPWEIHVFNLLGQEVYAASAPAGMRRWVWYPQGLPAGQYFIRIERQGKAEGYYVVHLSK